MSEDEGEQESVLTSIRLIEDLCKDMGLQFSAKYCVTLREAILKKETECKEAERMLMVLQERIGDETESCLLMQIPNSKSQYFNDPRGQFGKSILDKFPSTIFDVEEAGKSYAAARNTACVFHLSRVMESGLRALGKSLQIPDPNPTWDAVLKKCDAELSKPVKDRSPEWKTNDQLFSEATANLRAVKNAWRNPTMHIGTQYSDEIAEDIFRAVRGFMRHLATKLNETP